MPRIQPLLAIAPALLAPLASAQGLTWRDQESIGWACGGIGFEERQTLREYESRGNVGLLFVTATRGGLVADVRLRVVAVNDPSRGLEITAEGPQCVLRLTAGEWLVQARYGDVTREKTFSLRTSTPAPLQRIQLSFPNGLGETPRASPEESSQVGDWGKVGR